MKPQPSPSEAPLLKTTFIVDKHLLVPVLEKGKHKDLSWFSSVAPGSRDTAQNF
jgi:hypothetical protein